MIEDTRTSGLKEAQGERDEDRAEVARLRTALEQAREALEELADGVCNTPAYSSGCDVECKHFAYRASCGINAVLAGKEPGE